MGCGAVGRSVGTQNESDAWQADGACEVRCFQPERCDCLPKRNSWLINPHLLRPTQLSSFSAQHHCHHTPPHGPVCVLAVQQHIVVRGKGLGGAGARRTLEIKRKLAPVQPGIEGERRRHQTRQARRAARNGRSRRRRQAGGAAPPPRQAKAELRGSGVCPADLIQRKQQQNSRSTPGGASIAHPAAHEAVHQQHN